MTVATPEGAPDPASAHGEAVLMYAAVMYRAYGLTQVIFTAALGWAQHPTESQLVWLSGLIIAESLAIMAACYRRHRIPPSVMTADVAFNTVVLFLAAWLSALPREAQVIDYTYTYTVITSVGIGFAYRRYRTVVALTIVLAAANYVAEIIFHHGTFFLLAPNSLSYFTNTAVAWVIARYLRRINARLDSSRAAALTQAEALAVERERVRHARILHDRVLQTMETLARGNWLTDQGFRHHIAREAAWLRALIGGGSGQHGDLLTGLRELVQDYAAAGLHVDFTAAQLDESEYWRPALTGEAGTALVDAAREALTNVAKHGGVTEATMRAECTPGSLTVSILDHGIGFDQARTSQGIGIKESITRRINDVGGTTTIQSAPGAGTYVELTIPLRPELIAWPLPKSKGSGHPVVTAQRQRLWKLRPRMFFLAAVRGVPVERRTP